MKKISLLLSFSALLVLSACSLGQSGDTAPPPVGNNSGAVQQNVAQPASNQKMMMKEPSCDQLKLAKNKENCVSQLNDMVDQLLQQEIRQTFDLARCATLSENFADACQRSVEASGVKGPITVAQSEALREAMSPSFDEENPSVGPAYDLSKCSSLDSASGLKAYCEKSVQSRIDQAKIDQILATGGSASDCNTLSGQDLVARCQSFFGVIPE